MNKSQNANIDMRPKPTTPHIAIIGAGPTLSEAELFRQEYYRMKEQLTSATTRADRAEAARVSANHECAEAIKSRNSYVIAAQDHFKEVNELKAGYQLEFAAQQASHQSYIDDLMSILGAIPSVDSLTEKAKTAIKELTTLRAQLRRMEEVLQDTSKRARNFEDGDCPFALCSYLHSVCERALTPASKEAS